MATDEMDDLLVDNNPEPAGSGGYYISVTAERLGLLPTSEVGQQIDRLSVRTAGLGVLFHPLDSQSTSARAAAHSPICRSRS